MARDAADTARIQEQIRRLRKIRDEMLRAGEDVTGLDNEIAGLEAALTD